MCWAFSCATMIRTECRRLFNYLFDIGNFNEVEKQKCSEYINQESVHTSIRNLIMCILLPKKLHFDGKHQAAFLRAAVSRVRNSWFLHTYFRSPTKPYWSKRDCFSSNQFIDSCLEIFISDCPVQV